MSINPERVANAIVIIELLLGPKGEVKTPQNAFAPESPPSLTQTVGPFIRQTQTPEPTPLKTPPPAEGAQSQLPTIEEFRDIVMDPAKPDKVTGVYAPDTFIMRVGQQPKGDREFVAYGWFTQFQDTRDGVVGILGHAGDTGDEIKDLEINTKFALVYGNGDVVWFTVDAIETYTALEPRSPTSSFRDKSGALWSTEKLYDTYYTNRGTKDNKRKVTLQTCINDKNGTPVGRYFVSAEETDGPDPGITHLPKTK
jgi:hypothetical protein